MSGHEITDPGDRQPVSRYTHHHSEDDDEQDSFSDRDSPGSSPSPGVANGVPLQVMGQHPGPRVPDMHDINEHHHMMHAAQMSHHDHIQNQVMTAAQAAQAAAQAAAAHEAQQNVHVAQMHPHSQSAHHLANSMHNPPAKVKRVQTRRSWTPEEDKRLIELVNAEGGNCWSQIASHLDGRVGKQCRERWRNHLDPSIRRDSFAPEEDERILEFVQELGTRWSKIAQRLPGRTENAVKNRYHCFLKNRDSNGGKRARDDRHALLQKHKRAHTDKFQNLMFESEMGAKSSPEGSFTCNLLGCGKQYSQLSHLLAHRLTHFTSDGRHPSLHHTGMSAMHSQPSQSMPSVVEQRMDLLSQVTNSSIVKDDDKLKDEHHHHHHHHMHHEDHHSMMHPSMLAAVPMHHLHMQYEMHPLHMQSMQSMQTMQTMQAMHHHHHLSEHGLMAPPSPQDISHPGASPYHTVVVDDGVAVKLEDALKVG
eukprot:c16840_g1_i1.p1 GENE.c16840_g1_i1~~c16840_g1_i1.p1  ORF type:complete len:477 (+),score=87.57 c16840_g1_i1:116-1546(+)